MKKKFLLPVLFLFLFCLTPVLAQAQIVTCHPTCTTDAKGNVTCTGQCTLCNFFQMLVNIYSFIVVQLATPLAIVAFVVGAIFTMISGGDPSLFNRGKEIIKWAAIGLILAFASFIIIRFILETIGYTGTWDTINC